jgi:hypothetical protein
VRRKLTPWQKIIRAAHFGTGLRLTEDEVWALSCDHAIEQCASNDTEEQGGDWPKWMDGGKSSGVRPTESEATHDQ